MSRMSGFTLIEMVMAMILIAILAVGLLPRAPTQDALTLTGRAEQLASDIRYVQTLSMTTGARHCLTLTSSAYSLWSGATCATSVAHPGGLAQPVQLCSGCLADTISNQVRFDGKGRPYLDATTLLSGTQTITVSGDGGPRTISISGETGRVIVQ